MTLPPLPPELDPRGRHRGRSGAGSAARPIGRVLGAVLSVCPLVVASYYWSTFRNINSGLTRVPVVVGQAPPHAVAFKGDDQNILLVGNDDRTNMTRAEEKALHTGRGDGSNSTDTMMIMHLPADGSRATLISLPRDSYVDIPGFNKNKLNAAYVDGYTNASSGATVNDRRKAGANLLIKTVSDLTGLTINHYVQVSLLGFYELSNAIGGVPINLCHNVDDTLAHNRANNVSGGSGFKMRKGHHSIRGVQALAFVRQRHNFPGDREDLDRVRRQQYFLTAAFRQVASFGILLKLKAVGEAIKRTVYLDGSLDLLQLARQLENLNADHIVGKTIPTVNASLDDGTSILQVRPGLVRHFVDRLLNPDSSGSTTPRGPSSRAKSRRTSPAPALDKYCIN